MKLNPQKAVQSKKFGEYWELVETFYHQDTNNNAYTEKLLRFLESLKATTVLDASCGAGFPALELIKRGFHMTCADGDASMLEIFKKRSTEMGLAVSAYHSRWVDLPKKINTTFDAVLCLDSSITHVDSWGLEQKIDIPKAQQSVRDSLRAFHTVLNLGGTVVIGLGKYAFEKDAETKIYDFKPIVFNGTKMTCRWIVALDYHTRIKTWTSIVTIGDNVYQRVFETLVITSNELIDWMKETGFQNIKTKKLTPEEYDINIIGAKT